MPLDATRTIEEIADDIRGAPRPPAPGAVVLFSGERAVHAVLHAEDGVVLLGREQLGAFGLADGLVSRNHAECRWDGAAWTIRDLGSRNGTSVDGRPLAGGPQTAIERAVVRVGGTLAWLVPDVGRFVDFPVHAEGDMLVGAAFGAALSLIRVSAEGQVLHITGPSGSGKELAARAFHRYGPRPDGPFVAVNCAAIPEAIAERVLFGARKGAFSGAHADSVGYVQEADGGTLFLDEIAELDIGVQAKLLRALEAREVLPLGATRPVRVDVRFCSATHRDLRALVDAKRFRADLFFRVGRPHVALPPLRARVDEIVFLVERKLRALDRVAHPSLIEACMTRPWPGNARELLVEVEAAGRLAKAHGEARVRASDLSASAGLGRVSELPGPLGPSQAPAQPPAPLPASSQPSAPREPPLAAPKAASLPARAIIEETLRATGGRVLSASKALGVHRNQLRRWLAANNVDPRSFGPDGGDVGETRASDHDD